MFVPIDPRARGEKLAFMLDSAGCRGVIAADYALDNLLAVRASLSQLSWVIGLETHEDAKPLSDFPGVLSYRA
ncbi:ATP-dependent acyl-CoA ligase, partial [Burkholderia sp. SIMBA_019]